MDLLVQIAALIRAEFNNIYSGIKGGEFSRRLGPDSATAKTLATIEMERDAAIAAMGATKADLVGGKIPQEQLPAIAISETFVVASEAAMLLLTAQTGDVAVRTDIEMSFILAGTDPTLLAHWQELKSPTVAVQSVAGKTGTVILVAADITDLGTYAEFQTEFTTGLL
jgi:hypothetical protein